MNDGPDQMANAAICYQLDILQPSVNNAIPRYTRGLVDWPGAMSRKVGYGDEYQAVLQHETYLERSVQEKTKELVPIPRARRHCSNLPSEIKVCRSCGTTATPTWRWAGSAKDVLLCNACSLRLTRSRTRLVKEACMHVEAFTGKAPGKRDSTCISAEQEWIEWNTARRSRHNSTYGSQQASKRQLECSMTDFVDREGLAGILLKEKLRLLGAEADYLHTNEWPSQSWIGQASGNSQQTPLVPPLSLQLVAAQTADPPIAANDASPSSSRSSLSDSFPEIHDPLASIGDLTPCLGLPSAQVMARRPQSPPFWMTRTEN